MMLTLRPLTFTFFCETSSLPPQKSYCRDVKLESENVISRLNVKRFDIMNISISQEKLYVMKQGKRTDIVVKSYTEGDFYFAAFIAP